MRPTKGTRIPRLAELPPPAMRAASAKLANRLTQSPREEIAWDHQRRANGPLLMRSRPRSSETASKVGMTVVSRSRQSHGRVTSGSAILGIRCPTGVDSEAPIMDSEKKDRVPNRSKMEGQRAERPRIMSLKI